VEDHKRKSTASTDPYVPIDLNYDEPQRNLEAFQRNDVSERKKKGTHGIANKVSKAGCTVT
jgi:hypothetical protein